MIQNWSIFYKFLLLNIFYNFKFLDKIQKPRVKILYLVRPKCFINSKSFREESSHHRQHHILKYTGKWPWCLVPSLVLANPLSQLKYPKNQINNKFQAKVNNLKYSATSPHLSWWKSSWCTSWWVATYLSTTLWEECNSATNFSASDSLILSLIIL